MHQNLYQGAAFALGGAFFLIASSGLKRSRRSNPGQSGKNAGYALGMILLGVADMLPERWQEREVQLPLLALAIGTATFFLCKSHSRRDNAGK